MPPPRLRIVARMGPPASPLHRFLIGSALVHAVLVVLIVLLPRLGRGPRIPADALFVELAPAFPSAAAAAASAPAPEAPAPEVPAEPAEGVHVETSPPKKIEPLEKEPEKKPLAKQPEPRPEPAAPAPGGGPAVESVGGPGAGHSISPLAGGDLEFAWYRAQVTSALYSNWQRPILTGLREPIEVSVGFDIDRDGRVLNLRVEGSSGVPSLDRSALRAVGDASPLPPLPSNWRQPRLEAVFVFRLYPEGP